MSDPIEEEIVFSDPHQETDDFEITVLKDGEVAPEPPKPVPDPTKVQMTMEEYQALQSKIDPTAALTAGLSQLGERLGTPAPANVPTPVDDWDPSKLESDLFATGKSVPTIEKILDRKMGAYQAQLTQNLILQNKQMLQINPKTSELFQTYEKDIERWVANVPSQYRFQPGIYEQAYKQVIQEHQSEIIQAGITAGMTKATADAAAAAAAKVPARTPLYNETSGGALKPVLPKVFVTPQDVRNIAESGMDPSNKDHVRAYLSLKKEHGGK